LILDLIEIQQVIPPEDPGSEAKLGEEPRKRQSSFSFHSSSATTNESSKMTEEGDSEPKRIRFQQTSTVKGKRIQTSLILFHIIDFSFICFNCLFYFVWFHC
jgi:hypothetical protein